MATPVPVAHLPPQLVHEPGDEDTYGAYAPIIRRLFDSGHPRWGFLVYRVYYDDEQAWQRFMDILCRNSDNQIRRKDKARLLPYLSWTLMEDRTAFEGASKDTIRDAFRAWTAARSVERDGPGADNPRLIEESPRYRACLYVDKEVMESATMIEHHSSISLTGVHFEVAGQVVLIDGEYGIELIPERSGIDEHDLLELESGDIEPEDLEEDEYSPIEGKTTFEVGWQYVDLRFVVSVYEAMCQQRDAWISEHFYQRPPAVWDGS